MREFRLQISPAHFSKVYLVFKFLNIFQTKIKYSCNAFPWVCTERVWDWYSVHVYKLYLIFSSSALSQNILHFLSSRFL